MTRMPTRAPLIAANLAAIAFCFASWTRHGVSFAPIRLDLDVYRIGGRVWLAGGDLYGALPKTADGIGLPFTYPPFAAIVLSPLSLIPLGPAGIIVTLVTIALLAVTLRMYLTPLGWSLAAVLPLALMLEPVRSTIDPGLALALNALAALLVSPVSWTHHWVWAAPALLALAAAGGPMPGARPAAVCGLGLFLTSPEWLLPHGGNRELHWALWQQAIGSCYVLFAVGV
jgi:hypothetical protein